MVRCGRACACSFSWPFLPFLLFGLCARSREMSRWRSSGATCGCEPRGARPRSVRGVCMCVCVRARVSPLSAAAVRRPAGKGCDAREPGCAMRSSRVCGALPGPVGTPGAAARTPGTRFSRLPCPRCPGVLVSRNMRAGERWTRRHMASVLTAGRVCVRPEGSVHTSPSPPVRPGRLRPW